MNLNTKQAEILKFLCLGISYAFSYAYICFFTTYLPNLLIRAIFLSILSIVAIIWLELTMKQQSLLGKDHHTARLRIETRFWEAILLLLSINTYLGFRPELSFLLMHPVLIYMVLCGTGHLISDRSSVLLPGDLVNGTFRIPFRNFLARIFSVSESISARRAGKSASSSAQASVSSSASIPATGSVPKHSGYFPSVTMTIPVPHETPNNSYGQEVSNQDSASNGAGKIFGTIGVLILILVIFVEAFGNLASMDGNFKYVSDSIDHFFSNISFFEVIARFFFSIPVGMYLFGLFQGSVRMDSTPEKDLYEHTIKSSQKLRFLPNVLVALFLGLFVLVYLAFFISQASYMFSAFAGVLPQEFTASEYAVSGFHELINVVLINFVLMSVIRIFGSHDHRFIKAGSVALMTESCIFACISASKIILYMSRFGFTVSRTLGLWGTAVVFVGSILTIVHLLTGKKLFAPWLWFSAASYVMMNFIAFPFT